MAVIRAAKPDAEDAKPALVENHCYFNLQRRHIKVLRRVSSQRTSFGSLFARR